MTTDVRSLLLKELEILGGEKAPKGTLKKLSVKYNIPDSTVRRWKKEEKEKKRTFEKKKVNERKKITNEKEIEISKDILNGKSKKEIMETHGIKKSAYYEKTKTAKQVLKDRTQEHFEDIVRNVLGNKILPLLHSAEKVTFKLTTEILNSVVSGNIDIKTIKEKNEIYQIIQNHISDYMKKMNLSTLQELTSLLNDIDKENIELERLEISKEYLEIEKLKNKKDVEDNKIEIELVGI